MMGLSRAFGEIFLERGKNARKSQKRISWDGWKALMERVF
jgi:hypothetical protein